MASSLRTIACTSVPNTTCTYRVPYDLDSSKPTIVLVHSFASDATLYRPQYEDEKLESKVNFVAVDLLGHGGTETKGEEWDYWDNAKMVLEVIDRVGIKKAWAMGSSQGGWIIARMALLAPEKIAGLISIATSMAAETPHTTEIGCWDGPGGLTPLVDGLSASEPTPDFAPPDDFINFLMSVNFGQSITDSERNYWPERMRKTYAGDQGRRKLQHCAKILRDRDGLEERLAEIKCPLLWFHGDKDEAFSIRNAEEGMEGLKKGGGEKRLEVIEGGPHLLGVTHTKIVNEKTLEFIEKHR